MPTNTIIILFLALILCFNLQVHSQTNAPDTSYTSYQTWLKLRKNYPDIKIVNSNTTQKLLQEIDVVYKTITDSGVVRLLHLDIFRPVKKAKIPALLMIHGGGWRSGNKRMEWAMAQYIASKGIVVIPVEYRLSLEAVYPAAVRDIKSAICWVKLNAEKYGIDTTKIAIEGESAGGQLATLVAMTNNEAYFDELKKDTKVSSTVHACINVDGLVDFLAPNSINYSQKTDSPAAIWLGGIYQNKPLIWKDASPIFWVEKNAVPVLFISSSVPRFHTGRDEMIDMLRQNNVYCESKVIHQSPHSFWLFEPWFTPTANYIVRFLNRVF